MLRFGIIGALWENFFVSERLKYNHYNGRYVNAYFWRMTQCQEINYIEEADDVITVFEIKWHRKIANNVTPSAFCKAHPIKESVVVTPENYLSYLM